MPIRYEIHPTIGIARVGNSEEAFIGPEPGIQPPASYRDTTGKLLRQAARFRVFRCDRDNAGKLLSATEITHGMAGADQAAISWRVKLANRKGVAPRFTAPGRRNGATGNDVTDAALIIGPVSKIVGGLSQSLSRFPSGQFKGVPVELGMAGTDASGHLLLAGGAGRADSVPSQGDPSAPGIMNFADNDDWFDDVADGSVNAQLTFANGTTVDAVGAWVIVAPPDYAPSVHNFVTLYDVCYQVAVDRGWLQPANPPSFERNIRPILQRAVDYQWVNRLAFTGHSDAMGGDFASMWADLASSDTSVSGPLAQNVLRRLRNPALSAPPIPQAARWMPRLHDENNNTQVLPLTPTQYNYLVQWSMGNFVSDLGSVSPAALLPDAIDRAGLEACAGGAFFPGIEVGRIIRDANLYDAPFHLASGLEPGMLTAGNALPWQADFSACRYEQQLRMAWWPAQRPDHVFTIASPTTPVNWDDGASSDISLVANWWRLGIVRPVTAGGMQETERDPTLVPPH